MVGKCIRLDMFEDNQATMRVLQTGKAPTMRHFPRAHGVPLKWIFNAVKQHCNLCDCVTSVMSADISTQHFINEEKWIGSCSFVGVVEPKTWMRFSKIGNNGSGNGGSKPKTITNKTVVHACPARFVGRGGLGAMKCCAKATLLPAAPIDVKGSAGETAGIDDEQDLTSTTFVIGIRQKVTRKAKPTEQTFDGARSDRVNKGEKGGAN